MSDRDLTTRAALAVLTGKVGNSLDGKTSILQDERFIDGNLLGTWVVGCFTLSDRLMAHNA